MHRPPDPSTPRRSVLLSSLATAAFLVLLASATTARAAPESTDGGAILVHVTLNGDPAPPGTRLWVHQPGDRDDPIGWGWPDESLELPAGTYDVLAELPVNVLDPVRVWRERVEVKVGETVRFELNAVQKLGSIRATVVSGEERIDGAAVLLLPSGTRGFTPHSFPDGEVRTLPPGRYTVRANLESSAGPITGYADGVEITADELTEVTVNLGPTGLLQVDVKDGSYGDGVMAGLVPEGHVHPVGWLLTFSPDRVKAGTYDLMLKKAGVVPQVWWHRGVEVRAGETTTVVVSPPPLERLAR